jgi:hypothetical protein
MVSGSAIVGKRLVKKEDKVWNKNQNVYGGFRSICETPQACALPGGACAGFYFSTL